MHHVPVDPPRAARATSAPIRRAAPRRRSGYRAGRLALSAALSTVVTALVLAVPVMAGTRPDSPVVLGHDGGPLPSSAFAGLTSAATFSSATGEASATPSATSSSAAAPSTAPSATAPVPTPPAPDPVSSAPAAPPAPPEVVAEPVAPAPEAPAPAPAPAPKPAPAPAPAAAPAPASGGVEGQVLALVNAERAAAGCGAVSADAGLAAVARAHSEDMRDRNFFNHVNLDGLDPFDRADRAGVAARAENIARGQQTAAAVMDSWMNSAGHRANILNCGLTRLGVGVAQGGNGPWWTQLFG